MTPRGKLSHVGEVQVEGDKKAPFGHYALPNGRIDRTAQSLVGDPIGRVPCLAEQLGMCLAKVLVKFDQGGTHGNGTSSCSFARAAA